MGQRLNVEIKYGGELLANAYYHWYGYTSSSIEITSKILDDFSRIEQVDDPLKTAVQLLFNTGARFNAMELSEIRKEGTEKEKYILTDEKPVNRNSGLLCISKNGMKETEECEEARVEIDIKSKEVDFRVMCAMLADSYNEEKEDYENWKAFEDLPVLDPNPDDEISFDKWIAFADNVLNLIKEKQYVVKDKFGELVYLFIE